MLHEYVVTMTRTQLWSVLKQTAREWSDDNVSRLAAAISYYVLLSLAPLLLVVVVLVGLVLGEDQGRAEVIAMLGSVVGEQALTVIETLVNNERAFEPRSLGSAVGLAVALFGASGAFVELQAALNMIWDVPNTHHSAVRRYAIERFWSFVMVIAVAALLLLSLLASAALAIAAELFESWLHGGSFVWQSVNALASVGLTACLFALVFRVIPDVPLTWRDVWPGALGTAVLFVLGNLLIGLYLGESAITSAFGGAGSVVALVIWVYYSAQLLFLGAEFTQVYTRLLGSHSRARFAASKPGPSLATAATK